MTSPASHVTQQTTRRPPVRRLAEHSPLYVPEPSQEERRERNKADAAGIAYLLFRDHRGRERIAPLTGDIIVVGRDEEAPLAIGWDPAVSRHHAALKPGADGGWLVEDQGSTNGTYVNRVRIREPRLLRHHDVLQIGDTPIAFCAPRG